MGSAPAKVMNFMSKPEPLPMDFKSKKDRYISLRQKCNLLIGRDLTDKLIEIEEGPLNAIKIRIESSYATYESKIKEAEINQQEYYDVMYETVTAKVIRKHLMVPNFNLFKAIPLFCSKLNLKESQSALLKSSLEAFQKEFENSLRSIVYNLSGDFKDLPDSVLLGINRNIKFNETIEPDILNLILTPSLMKREDLILDLAEMIEHSQKLQIVSIIFDLKDDDGNQYDIFNFSISHHRILYRLMNAINLNRTIKALFLHCTTDFGIAISPETSALIINKIQSETLVAFHIGGFDFSEQFMANLMFQIASTRALLFLGIHSNNIWNISVDQNASLNAIAFTGYGNNDHVTDKERQFQDKAKKGVLGYFGVKSIIQFPFSIA